MRIVNAFYSFYLLYHPIYPARSTFYRILYVSTFLYAFIIFYFSYYLLCVFYFYDIITYLLSIGRNGRRKIHRNIYALLKWLFPEKNSKYQQKTHTGSRRVGGYFRPLALTDRSCHLFPGAFSRHGETPCTFRS